MRKINATQPASIQRYNASLTIATNINPSVTTALSLSTRRDLRIAQVVNALLNQVLERYS